MIKPLFRKVITGHTKGLTSHIPASYEEAMRLDERARKNMNNSKIVTQDEWLSSRIKLLDKEKDLDKERDQLSMARRELPMVKVGTEYVFDGPQGPVSLRDLFEGRRQLIVYHFMFDPDSDTGCKHCSCTMDNIAGSLIHLTARDTSFAAISRAQTSKIEPFKSRMQWTFPWVSSYSNDFNYDYHVTLDPDKGSTTLNYREVDVHGEMPGLSVFFRDNDQIFYSYSTYLRGLDTFMPMYHLLDITPLGRGEDKSNSVAAGEASWIHLP